MFEIFHLKIILFKLKKQIYPKFADSKICRSRLKPTGKSTTGKYIAEEIYSYKCEISENKCLSCIVQYCGVGVMLGRH